MLNFERMFMENKKFRGLLIIEAILIVILMVILLKHVTRIPYSNVEIYRESSPDGRFTVVISEVESGNFLFDEKQLEIYMYPVDLSSSAYYTSLKTEVADSNIDSQSFKIEWLDFGAEVTINNASPLKGTFFLSASYLKVVALTKHIIMKVHI